MGCERGVVGCPTNRCLPHLHTDLCLQKRKVADAGEIITFVLWEYRGSKYHLDVEYFRIFL